MIRTVKTLSIAAVGLCMLFALSFSAAARAEGNWYLRAGVGVYNYSNARLSDVKCAQTKPPALFGCQSGNNGRPIGADGEFEHGFGLDLGVGHRFLPWLRGEVLLNWRPDLDYSAQANFLKVPGKQPVNASGESIAAFAIAWFDLPAMGRWRPYLGIGAGAARNHIGPVTYRFPGLGAGDYTRSGGGNHVDFAWLLGAGVSVRLTSHFSLDIGLRYSDLGEVRTDAGTISIVRKGQTFVIDAGGTRADLTLTSLLVGLRYRF